jgi:hypothetical protein
MTAVVEKVVVVMTRWTLASFLLVLQTVVMDLVLLTVLMDVMMPMVLKWTWLCQEQEA